jgi:hypothetical protein
VQDFDRREQCPEEVEYGRSRSVEDYI